ncbi:hypothetical protein EKH77_31520 [Streptomyces luteoverticillatus]|uniref:Uncharacterized protein n=1 Tax=Streptomyces luteoverticillatus TaxID=66425 RepID=A0A3Q9G409_STRLT|nr:hypothetical protein [Streptomyces luteoverticillatus]AZQ75081.1 hypothetical protein EKH77_31520 [Streptomyces luteoverticillatus]
MNSDMPPVPLPLATDSRIPVRAVADATTADYDRYFHIARHAPDLTSWTRGVLRLQSAVLADLPHTGLNDSQRAAVLTGLVHASHATLAAWLPSVPGSVPGSAPDGPTDGPGDALRRWKLGHQLFHLLLTTMNSTLDDTLATVGAARWGSVPHGLGRLRALYDAATATMAYASDFPASVYANDVRPTMEPPFAPPGFSGMLNQEHQVMTERARALTAALGGLSPLTPSLAMIHHEAALLRAAQRRNRKAHAEICERCVPDGASLLRQHTTRDRSDRATDE